MADVILLPSPSLEDEGLTKVLTEDESMEYEEIKKKDADLDDAIREEELIEAELRQVEQDFERV